MKRVIFFAVFALCVLLPNISQAIEIVRQKNVATYIIFPIVDADGDVVSSAAGLDSEIDIFSDAAAPDGFADCTNEATEIGSAGIYYLSLTQAEMNNDYVYIQIKTTTSGAKTQHILIRTMIGDPLNLATTDDGGTMNITAGKIDEVSTLTGHTAQTGDSFARLGAPAGVSVSADIAAVKLDSAAILTDTNELQANQNWNVWDDGTRTLTALDEDSTTIDLDGSTIGTATSVINAVNITEAARTSITGGAYALDSDANGRIRIVDGIGAGELDTDSGTVLLRSATETQIDAIETKILRMVP